MGSVGEYYWDLEADVMDAIFKRVEDEQLARLILEYGGFKWAMLSFPYPEDENGKVKKDKNDHSVLMQGAMSEVFESGSFENFNVLLLAKIARDPKTNNFNHWEFK